MSGDKTHMVYEAKSNNIMCVVVKGLETLDKSTLKMLR